MSTHLTFITISNLNYNKITRHIATFHAMSDDIRTILGYKLTKIDRGNFARIKNLRKWRKN
jgi:hypothetical protein